MCINCNIRLPVPQILCQFFDLDEKSLFSAKQLARYATSFKYWTMSNEKVSLLKQMIGDDYITKFEQYAVDLLANKNTTGTFFDLIRPEDYELHPVGRYIIQQMQELMPELNYKTLANYKILDKRMHVTSDGYEYLSGTYIVTEESDQRNNWEILQSLYKL